MKRALFLVALLLAPCLLPLACSDDDNGGGYPLPTSITNISCVKIISNGSAAYAISRDNLLYTSG